VNPPEPVAAENPYRAPDDVAIGERSWRRWRLAAGILIAYGVPLALMTACALVIDVHYLLRAPKGRASMPFPWRAELAMFLVGACLTASGVFLWQSKWRSALISGIPVALFSYLAARFFQQM
jgi:hypothetical protein